MAANVINDKVTPKEAAGPSEDDVRGFISGTITATMFGIGLMSFFQGLNALTAVRISINLASDTTPFIRFDDGYYLYIGLQFLKALSYLVVVLICSVVALVAQLLRLR